MMRTIWTRKLVAIVGAFVAANLIALALGQVLAPPLTFATRGMQYQAEVLEARGAQGCVDIAIAGNSVSFQDIIPTLLADQSGYDSAQSVGIAATIASIDVDWMSNIALPPLRPSVVVWVASLASLLPAEDVEGLLVSLYSRAPATSHSAGAGVDRELSDYVPLIRERPAISNFEAIVDQITGDLPRTADDAFADRPGLTRDPDGFLRTQQVFRPELGDFGPLREAFDLVVPDWAVDEDQVQIITDYLKELEADGVTTIVVVPPATETIIDLIPGGALNYRRHVAAAREVADASGSLLLDESEGGYTNSQFSDTHHLNEDGATELTTRLADVVESSGAPPCSS